MLTLKQIIAVQKMREAVGAAMNEGSCFGVTDSRELRQMSPDDESGEKDNEPDRAAD